MAFAQLEPFGGAVDDLRAGIGPAVALNMHRAENTEPITPGMFFPWSESPPKPEAKPQTPEEIAEALRVMLTAKGKPNEH